MVGSAVIDTRPDRGGRLAPLDGVRGLAILIVVIHNVAFVLRPSTLYPLKLVSAVTATGWIGVQLFFVLSGFLITGILLQTRTGQGYFRNFYIRRTLRIFPLYYAFLIGALVLFPLVADPGWTAIARKNQWWYWTYTSNWSSPFGHVIPGLSHFWSLAVEEQFYLLWPLIVWLLSPRALKALCVVVIAVTPLIRWALATYGLPAQASYEFTIARWDALAFGALLAILMRDDGSRAWLARHMARITGLVVVALLAFLVVEHGFHEDDVQVQVIGQAIAGALFFSLVYFSVVPAAGETSRVQRVLSAPSLRFLGKYSYAIYVFHFPIHRLASRWLAEPVNGADTYWRLLRLLVYGAGVGAASVLLAMLSWRILEKPFLDLKDRLAPHQL
jgi:peptidoglycan/LPS O-acetylase OafA/YrhL